MFGRKRIAELEEQLEDMEEKKNYYHRLSAKYRTKFAELQSSIEKESNMSNGAPIASNANSIDPEYNHRVYEDKPGSKLDRQVDDSKRKTFEEALNLAKELAARYPANTYKVVSTVAVVKADIPITTTTLAKFD